MQFTSPQALSAYSREAREARNDEDDDFVDPFADLKDGGDEELARLKLLFSWTPPQPSLLRLTLH